VPQDFSWLTSSQKRQPLLEHVRDLWTLHGIQGACTASIWQQGWFERKD